MISVEDERMHGVLREIMKDDFEQVSRDAANQAITNSLFQYVSLGGMTVEFAAKQRGLTPDAFVHDMTAAGYKVPQQQARP